MNEASERLREWVAGDLSKAGPGGVHKYIRRIRQGGRWRYWYMDPKTGRPYSSSKPPERHKRRPEAPAGGPAETPQAKWLPEWKGTRDAALKSLQSGKERHKAVSGKLTRDAVNTAILNAKVTLRTYSANLPGDEVDSMHRFLDEQRQHLHDALEAGDLVKVDASAVNEMMIGAVHDLVYQTHESAGRQLGDHGIRHILGNIEMGDQVFDALATKGVNGIKTSALDRFKVGMLQAYHDIGYTAEPAREGFKFTGRHKEYGLAVFDKHYTGRFKAVFGEKPVGDIRHTIATHDSADLDWQGDTQASVVRLSDNLALYAPEKLPALFRMVPGSIDVLEAIHASKGDQAKVLKLRTKLERMVDRAGIAGPLRAQLKNAAREVGTITPQMTLGMLGGAVADVQFDGQSVNVTVEQSALDTRLQKMFDMGQRQFGKFAESYGLNDLKADRFDAGGPPPVLRARIVKDAAKAPAWRKVAKETLTKAQEGQERSGHKYVKREKTAKGWKYWYKDPKTGKVYSSKDQPTSEHHVARAGEAALSTAKKLVKWLGMTFGGQSPEWIEQQKKMRASGEEAEPAADEKPARESEKPAEPTPDKPAASPQPPPSLSAAQTAWLRKKIAGVEGAEDLSGADLVAAAEKEGIHVPREGPGGHTPDGSGPSGRGAGPGGGRADGSGMDKDKDKGPGGHAPDGSGPHGGGVGPGGGRADGSGIDKDKKPPVSRPAPGISRTPLKVKPGKTKLFAKPKAKPDKGTEGAKPTNVVEAAEKIGPAQAALDAARGTDKEAAAKKARDAAIADLDRIKRASTPKAKAAKKAQDAWDSGREALSKAIPRQFRTAMAKALTDFSRPVLAVAALAADDYIPPGARLVMVEAIDEMGKSLKHKYIKRVKVKGRYRYWYAIPGKAGLVHSDHAQVGSAFKISDGHYHITGRDGDKVTVRHDETGKSETMTLEDLRAMIHGVHRKDLDKRYQRIKTDRDASKKHGTARQQALMQAALDQHVEHYGHGEEAAGEERPRKKGRPSEPGWERMPEAEELDATRSKIDQATQALKDATGEAAAKHKADLAELRLKRDELQAKVEEKIKAKPGEKPEVKAEPAPEPKAAEPEPAKGEAALALDKWETRTTVAGMRSHNPLDGRWIPTDQAIRLLTQNIKQAKARAKHTGDVMTRLPSDKELAEADHLEKKVIPALERWLAGLKADIKAAAESPAAKPEKPKPEPKAAPKPPPAAKPETTYIPREEIDKFKSRLMTASSQRGLTDAQRKEIRGWHNDLAGKDTTRTAWKAKIKQAEAMVAEGKPKPKLEPKPATKPAAKKPEPTMEYERAVLSYNSPRIGAIAVDDDGQRWRVKSTRQFRIDENDPSLYGSHFLGHEGERAVKIQYEKEGEPPAKPKPKPAAKPEPKAKPEPEKTENVARYEAVGKSKAKQFVAEAGKDVRIKLPPGLGAKARHFATEGQMKWWIKQSEPGGVFLRLSGGPHKGDEPLDVTVDLSPGVYTIGTGPYGEHGFRQDLKVSEPKPKAAKSRGVELRGAAKKPKTTAERLRDFAGEAGAKPEEPKTEPKPKPKAGAKATPKQIQYAGHLLGRLSRWDWAETDAGETGMSRPTTADLREWSGKEVSMLIDDMRESLGLPSSSYKVDVAPGQRVVPVPQRETPVEPKPKPEPKAKPKPKPKPKPESRTKAAAKLRAAADKAVARKVTKRQETEDRARVLLAVANNAWEDGERSSMFGAKGRDGKAERDAIRFAAEFGQVEIIKDDRKTGTIEAKITAKGRKTLQQDVPIPKPKPKPKAEAAPKATIKAATKARTKSADRLRRFAASAQGVLPGMPGAPREMTKREWEGKIRGGYEPESKPGKKVIVKPLHQRVTHKGGEPERYDIRVARGRRTKIQVFDPVSHTWHTGRDMLERLQERAGMHLKHQRTLEGLGLGRKSETLVAETAAAAAARAETLAAIQHLHGFSRSELDFDGPRGKGGEPATEAKRTHPHTVAEEFERLQERIHHERAHGKDDQDSRDWLDVAEHQLEQTRKYMGGLGPESKADGIVLHPDDVAQIHDDLEGAEEDVEAQIKEWGGIDALDPEHPVLAHKDALADARRSMPAKDPSEADPDSYHIGFEHFTHATGGARMIGSNIADEMHKKYKSEEFQEQQEAAKDEAKTAADKMEGHLDEVDQHLGDVEKWEDVVRIHTGKPAPEHKGHADAMTEFGKLDNLHADVAGRRLDSEEVQATHKRSQALAAGAPKVRAAALKHHRSTLTKIRDGARKQANNAMITGDMKAHGEHSAKAKKADEGLGKLPKAA